MRIGVEGSVGWRWATKSKVVCVLRDRNADLAVYLNAYSNDVDEREEKGEMNLHRLQIYAVPRVCFYVYLRSIVAMSRRRLILNRTMLPLILNSLELLVNLLVVIEEAFEKLHTKTRI